MAVSLIACLALVALVEGLFFSAYCSTLEEGDGCCYPDFSSWTGSPTPSVSRGRTPSRRRRRRSNKNRHRPRVSGGSHQPSDATITAATRTSPAVNAISHRVGGDDSNNGGGGNSSAATTLIPSSSGDSFGHRSSSSSTTGSALRRGRGYSLRQRIMRLQRDRW